MFVAGKLDASTVSFNVRHGVMDSKEQILVGQKPVIQVVFFHHFLIRLYEDLDLGVFLNSYLGLRTFYPTQYVRIGFQSSCGSLM